MGPSLAPSNSSHLRPVDAEPLGEFIRGNGKIQRSYLYDIFFGQPCCVVSRPLRMDASPFFVPILVVVCAGSLKEMGRTYALWVIAPMESTVGGIPAVRKKERVAMGNLPSLSVPKSAVPIFEWVVLVNPTVAYIGDMCGYRAVLINSAPEQCFKFFGGVTIDSHGRVLSCMSHPGCLHASRGNLLL